MRGRWGLWVAMAVLGTTSLGWYVGLFAGLTPYVVALANHPGVAEAFSDPLSARTDALLMLVSVFLLTPVLLGLVLGVIVFAVIVALLISEPVLRPLNLPSWICVPLVLAGVGYGAWAFRGGWLPQLLYVGGLVAKASLVFFSTRAVTSQ